VGGWGVEKETKMRELTQKQENFVNCIFQGMTQREAWGKAGYSTRYPVPYIDSHACRLANKDKIKARLEELRQDAKSLLVADEIERKKILSEIARAKLAQFTDDAGVIDKRKLDSHAIQAIDEQRTGRGAAITKLRLHNPMHAIDLLNKMEKIYSSDTNINVDNRSINFIVRNKEEQEEIAKLVKKLNGHNTD